MFEPQHAIATTTGASSHTDPHRTLTLTQVRLKGIEFSRSQGGPQQRELRGRSNLSFLSEDMHNAILAACSGEE